MLLTIKYSWEKNGIMCVAPDQLDARISEARLGNADVHLVDDGPILDGEMFYLDSIKKIIPPGSTMFAKFHDHPEAMRVVKTSRPQSLKRMIEPNLLEMLQNRIVFENMKVKSCLLW
ncbi:hypothetical protein Molly5_37 [Maribacter phage Molly_5]|uniref:Uncharacterized protein n=1 Tax=Maribacter phage Molly_1 TaxID=2745685 RepID=A0A8E4XVU1_9CAUD|nr:hypothetical protein M1M29_gp037 [Maribacter phage Molly_1]QQO97719.1 hypothetical protein Molly2_37 [Maribacter phage Molly_2]QQO97919.1 hypothetical protein Molly3_37 [Maribacter phage Molly_3]QQO98119.1 hypothetical protein Molly4_37 [Maribacter phage Molly_4]QQO98319.1 hypothetical protein Molly5_37 [Maribacter phage Molly_5]QQO97519.1 hypothetical protein Molly1_37 [Maribacter phage Molly_1]